MGAGNMEEDRMPMSRNVGAGASQRSTRKNPTAAFFGGGSDDVDGGEYGLLSGMVSWRGLDV